MNSQVRTQMGSLHDLVTWYKITYTGEQVAEWDFQNNATRVSSPGPAFVLKVRFTTCSPVYMGGLYVTLYHVTRSCKEPIGCKTGNIPLIIYKKPLLFS